MLNSIFKKAAVIFNPKAAAIFAPLGLGACASVSPTNPTTFVEGVAIVPVTAPDGTIVTNANGQNVTRKIPVTFFSTENKGLHDNLDCTGNVQGTLVVLGQCGSEQSPAAQVMNAVPAYLGAAANVAEGVAAVKVSFTPQNENNSTNIAISNDGSVKSSNKVTATAQQSQGQTQAQKQAQASKNTNNNTNDNSNRNTNDNTNVNSNRNTNDNTNVNSNRNTNDNDNSNKVVGGSTTINNPPPPPPNNGGGGDCGCDDNGGSGPSRGQGGMNNGWSNATAAP